MSRLPSRAAWATSSRKSRKVSLNQGGRATGAAVAAPDAELGRREKQRQRSSVDSFIGACRRGSAPKDEIHRAHDSLSNLLYFLIGAGGKERPGAALSRNRDVRRDLCEGREHEGALVHAGVRDDEPRLGDHAIAVEQQVEIERARRAGKFAPAAETPLGGEQRLQQSPRSELGLDRGNRVDKVRLCADADRRAAVKGGRSEEARAGQLGERREGAAYLGFPVAEIGPQSYVGFPRCRLLSHGEQSSTRLRLRAEGAAPSRARRRRGRSSPRRLRRPRFRTRASV